MMSPALRRLLGPRAGRFAMAAVYVVFAATLPPLLAALFSPAAFTVAIHVSVLIAANAIAALGLNIIVGYCGLLNLGFAGFMLIGAYTTGILMKEAHWGFWAAVTASTAHGALWGIVLGIPTLRLTGDYFAIVTFGFSELVNMVAKNWVAVTRGPKGYPGVPRPVLDFSWLHSFGVAPGTNLRIEFRQDMRPAYWWLFSTVLGVCIIVCSRLSRSRLGRAWRAIREDEVAAESCGVNAMWTKTIAFAISAAFGALAGACLASYNAFVDFRYFEFMTSVFVLCYIVLGGMGTVAGPLAGTAVLVALGELLRENPARLLAGLFGRWPAAQDWLLAVPWAPNMRMILYGIILIVVIRFRPEGLFPSRSRARELHEHDVSGHADHETLYDLRTRD